VAAAQQESRPHQQPQHRAGGSEPHASDPLPDFATGEN
jgi:hypothetical protein